MLFEDATLVEDERERIKNMVESCSLEELSESLSRIAGRFLPTRVLSGRRDDGTTGPRDDAITALPLTLRVSSRAHPLKPLATTLLYCGSSFALRVGFYLPEPIMLFSFQKNGD